MNQMSPLMNNIVRRYTPLLRFQSNMNWPMAHTMLLAHLTSPYVVSS
jgi:hypothetical protein